MMETGNGMNENMSEERKKHSSVGLIPIDWEIHLGSEVAVKITKGSSPRWQGFEYQEDGILFVTSKNVREGFLDLNKKQYLPKEFGLKANGSKLQDGDILINIVGASIGRSCIYRSSRNIAANINQAVCLFRPKEIYNPEFLSYFIQSPVAQKRLLGTRSDSARPNLSLADIRDFLFPIPSKSEQDKIVNLIHTWDRAIDLTEQLVAEKQKRRKGLTQQLLTGKKRLPGFDGKWRKVQLNKIFERVQRSIHEGKTPEVLSITAKVGFVSQREKFSKVIAGKNLEKYVLIRRGEFSFNKGNSKTYPQGCVFRLKEFDEGAVPNVFYSFRTELPEVCPEFYSHFFASGGLNHQLSRVINTGVRNDGLLNLKVCDFFAVKIPLPPAKEQEQIAKILTLANQELDLLQTKADALREQKKGLMQQLLTGKMRVKS